MAINRSDLQLGPARVVFAGASFFSKDVIQLKADKTTFEIKTDAHGKLDDRVDSRQLVASFTPDGRISADIIDALWPYADAKIGDDLYTDTDRPCVFHLSDSGRVTMIAAAITKMPSLKLAATESMIGALEITGLRGNNQEVTVANSLLAIDGAGGTFADTGFAPAGIKTQPYTGTFGAVAGFADFYTEDGFTVDFDLQTQDIVIDQYGLITKKLVSVGIMVKCKPVGVTTAQILAALKLQDAAADPRGASFADTGFQLQIKGADAVNYVTIPKAELKTAGYRYGSLQLRNDEIGFVGARTFTAGSQNALWTLAAA